MISVSAKHSPDIWRGEEWLKNFLAEQLIQGRLSLVLGAGVSMGIGLPSWVTLIDVLYAEAGIPRNPGMTLEIAAETLLHSAYGDDRVRFAEAIRLALYREVNANPEKIETSQLLAALGALVMSSSRGRVSNVVTFNFDNLLEEHLESRGFVVRSVDALPSWADVGDVTVLHPHGLLPRDESVALSRGVVFTQHDYASIIGQERDLWRQRVMDIFRSSTCLFIGLSGGDVNLLSMLQDSGPQHCSHPDAYWGIRFSEVGDSMAPIWETRGVMNLGLASHSDLPIWLLDICKRAAKMRTRH